MDARYRIRPATPADAPALAELERVAFSDPWSETSLREVLSQSVAFGFVVEPARLDGPIGYVLGRAVMGEGEVLNLAVEPRHRRRGIARRLLGDALAWFRREGVGEVFLEVREGNSAAIALYQGQGFQVAGRRVNYYRQPVEAALVLRRSENRHA